MDTNGTEWWKPVPKQAIPGWLKVLGIVWIVVASFASVLYTGPVSVVVFLAVVLSFLPVVFVWQWVYWKTTRRIARNR